MTDERAELQASIERTQAALAAKAEQIERRVVEATNRVVQTLDVRSQYREHPWAFLLTALFAGFLTAARRSTGSAARHALGNHQGVELLG